MNNENDVKTYEEELACILERFNMTKEETLRVIIHEIYSSSVTFVGLQTALVLIGDYEDKYSCVECDINGNVIVDDDLEDTPF